MVWGQEGLGGITFPPDRGRARLPGRGFPEAGFSTGHRDTLGYANRLGQSRRGESLREISSPVQPWDELNSALMGLVLHGSRQCQLGCAEVTTIPILLANPSHKDWHITSASEPDKCQCATMGTDDTPRVPSVILRNNLIPFLPPSTLPGMAFSSFALPHGQS